MLLITGSNGQLGRCLHALLPNAVYADVGDLDITKYADVKNFVQVQNIDVIVNCAAYTNVEKAEEERDLAREINVIGTENLAKSGASVIQISTDYVFDGTSSVPYVENDTPNPLSVYGATKYESEKTLFASAETAIVIRTAWLYSGFGKNFVKTMRQLGQERSSLNVVFDQVGSPTYAPDLANAIIRVVESLSKGSHEIYHFSNEGACSWYDFAAAIMRFSRLPCEILPIESKDFPQKAKRPSFSVLNKSKIKNFLDIKIPHWQEALEKCINQF